MIKHIPNSLTIFNLLCGITAIIFCLYGDYNKVPILMALALLADFLDGFVARALKVKSDIGAQLDSLADMVTFGVLPAIMIYTMLSYKSILPPMETTANILQYELPLNITTPYAFIALVYAMAACWRLAKFNIDTRQTENFIGVATPAAAIFVLGLYMSFNTVYVNHLDWFYHHKGMLDGFIYHLPLTIVFKSSVIIVYTLLISFLMVSEIPFFSLKGNHCDHLA